MDPTLSDANTMFTEKLNRNYMQHDMSKCDTRTVYALLQFDGHYKYKCYACPYFRMKTTLDSDVMMIY